MLVKVSVENFKSFDKREELSMVSSSKMQGNKEHKIKIKQINLLKNAVVYGANASGKSNLFRVFDFTANPIIQSPLSKTNLIIQTTISINGFGQEKENDEYTER